jgi:hypothetical protein
MSPKAKKNRRNISQNKRGPGNFVTSPSSISTQTGQTQAAPEISSFSRSSKTNVYEVPNDTSFLKDIKWIGLVTLVIIILLIVAYLLFR